MKDRTLKSNLYHSLGQEVQPKRLGETINYCTEIMKEQMLYKEEPRTSFFKYLSNRWFSSLLPMINSLISGFPSYFFLL